MKAPASTSFVIDLDQKFVQLPRAPIVEAVLEWQVEPTKPLEQSELLSILSAKFSSYVGKDQHEVAAAVRGLPHHDLEIRQRTKWDGIRLTSDDQKHVCQFRTNSLVFSRLAPYQGWERFTSEALPFWELYKELSRPHSVARIGVRFISQIYLEEGKDVSAYVHPTPAPLKKINLSSDAFFYQDSFPIGDYPLRLNLVRTLQPPNPPLSPQRSLIVDIDVSTTETTALEDIDLRLREMRFVKNVVFFAYLKNAEKQFK